MVLRIEPGVYDIGTTPLPMRSWVDIEGSGIGATVITGLVSGEFGMLESSMARAIPSFAS